MMSKLMMVCMKQCGSFPLILLMSQMIIDLVNHWIWCPLVLWFFDIWINSDVTTGVYLHLSTYGIYVLFQSRVLHPITEVRMSAS